MTLKQHKLESRKTKSLLCNGQCIYPSNKDEMYFDKYLSIGIDYHGLVSEWVWLRRLTVLVPNVVLWESLH